jgi:hypothetical protein
VSDGLGGRGETLISHPNPVSDLAPNKSVFAAGWPSHSRTQWGAQVQLEMLVTGLPSALVVLDTPHRGASVFRMYRSDAYLEQMLRTVSRFYTW